MHTASLLLYIWFSWTIEGNHDCSQDFVRYPAWKSNSVFCNSMQCVKSFFWVPTKWNAYLPCKRSVSKLILLWHINSTYLLPNKASEKRTSIMKPYLKFKPRGKNKLCYLPVLTNSLWLFCFLGCFGDSVTICLVPASIPVQGGSCNIKVELGIKAVVL